MYYQMLTIKTEEGKPLIGNTKIELVDHLVYYYRNADGSLIRPSTVLAILEPSNVHLRPSINKRIDLQKIVDKYKAEED